MRVKLYIKITNEDETLYKVNRKTYKSHKGRTQIFYVTYQLHTSRTSCFAIIYCPRRVSAQRPKPEEAYLESPRIWKLYGN